MTERSSESFQYRTLLDTTDTAEQVKVRHDGVLSGNALDPLTQVNGTFVVIESKHGSTTTGAIPHTAARMTALADTAHAFCCDGILEYQTAEVPRLVSVF